METIAFCEIEPFCQAVLAKHWPNVPIFKDITKLSGADIEAIGGCDVICGGFPCQDISTAGKGAGIEGSRSGLWKEYARLIGELKPRYVIVENVAALRSRGLGVVLRDLAALGYDAEWHCIPASAIGARHRRDRIWIVANAISARLEGYDCQKLNCGLGTRLAKNIAEGRASDIGTWEIEPALGRVADGFPSWVAQLRALGNAVVPQIPEIIGRAILEHEERAA